MLIINILFKIFFFLDAETVARGVNEFFTGNRCIKTLDDIYK